MDGAVWSCKLLIALYNVSDCVAGFTLVCLGFERITAVTWPLRAKTILTLRTSVIFETTVNLLPVTILLPLIMITYTIDPKYGCTYDFSLQFTEFYIYLEESLPIINSLLSLSITIYLIIKIVLSKQAIRRLWSGGAISALEMSNITILLLLDVAHLAIYLPTRIAYLLLLIANLNSGFDSGFVFVLYQLADIFNLFIQVPHSITFLSISFAVVPFTKFFSGSALRS